MKLRGVCVAVVVLFGFAPVSYADNNVPKDFALPPMQLRDYSVEFKTDKNASAAPTAPTGLTSFTRESKRPFLGLSFKKPLSNRFLRNPIRCFDQAAIAAAFPFSAPAENLCLLAFTIF